MKKLYIIPLALFFLLSMTSNMLAASAVTTTPGDTVTISASGTGGSDLVFNPSPNTLIGYNIEAAGASFAVNSISDAAIASGEAIEYGMASDSNQVKRTARAASTFTLAAPTAADSSGI